MNRSVRTLFLLSLVFVFVLSMASTALAKPKAEPPSAPADPYVYADDPGWVTSGAWSVEDYTAYGGTKLLVANDAGATATYTVPAGYGHIQVASSTYWTCGVVEIYIDGALRKTVDLNSATTVWGVVIHTEKISSAVSHTLTIRATGTGGPGIVDIDGVLYDLSMFHFVNVQYLRYW